MKGVFWETEKYLEVRKISVKFYMAKVTKNGESTVLNFILFISILQKFKLAIKSTVCSPVGIVFGMVKIPAQAES